MEEQDALTENVRRAFLNGGLIKMIEDAMQLTYKLHGVTPCYNALCTALVEAKKNLQQGAALTPPTNSEGE